jgi:Domain of unknown function (DUF3303)
MKFMVTWAIPPENFKETFARFKEGHAKVPAGAKMIGRWHETGTGKGFMVVEVEDMVAFTGWLMGWSDLSHQTVVPVVEDEDIRRNL